VYERRSIEDGEWVPRDANENTSKGGAEGYTDEKESLTERKYARPVSCRDKDMVSEGGKPDEMTIQPRTFRRCVGQVSMHRGGGGNHA
jgi:hypothetical protein